MFITLKKKLSVLAGVLAIAALKLKITIRRTGLVAGLALLTAGLVSLLALDDASLNPASRSLNTQKDTSLKINEPALPATDNQTFSGENLLAPDAVTKARVSEAYGNLPLTFEVNQGQLDSQVQYFARGSGYNLFLTGSEAVFALRPHGKSNGASSDIPSEPQPSSLEQSVLRMRLVGASSRAETKALDAQPGKSNYFIGDDPKKWQTNVTHYARVQYTDVYPGVNLVYYGNQHQLEYDFVVSAGADPDVISLDFTGADKLTVDESGDLILETGEGQLRQHKPVIYQDVNGERKKVDGQYVIKDNQEVGFEIAEYDASKPLVIDPVLVYSTYLGGNSDETGYGIAVDSFGNAYVSGSTTSLNFPTANALPYIPSNSSNRFAFITKLSASGSWLVYSTYIGGNTDGSTESYGIAIDTAGSAYVTGYTSSHSFPKANAFQPAMRGGSDVFLTKLNSTGSALVYSTYLGGSLGDNEIGRGVAVDIMGSAYVTGSTRSTDFPTANPLQPAIIGDSFYGEAFVTKFNPAGTALVYSTYLGGYSYDQANSVAVDLSGNAYLTGFTYSNDFPTANAMQPDCGCSLGNCAGNNAVFITKLNPTGSALVYSTFLGGNGTEEGRDIAVDSSGNAYITGGTSSSNFPTVNPFQATNPGGSAFCNGADAFIAKINSSGSALVYSTYLGGYNNDGGESIAVDSSGSAYVAGGTAGNSPFPILNPVQSTYGGAFVTKLNSSGSALVFSTYLGGGSETARGIAIDSAGSAYVTGDTQSLNFPTTTNAFQPVFGGGNPNHGVRDVFVSKIGVNSTPPGFSVAGITPDRGGNTGFVSATIYGSGFANNATVKLVRAGQPDILATVVTVSQDSTVARVRFNLESKAPGVRDVVVTNPGGSSITLAGAFTVEAGGTPQVWADIIGRDEFRPGRPQTYYIAFGNRGNVDATLLPLIISIPIGAQYELGFDFLPLRQPIPGETFDFSQIPAHYETKTEKIIPLLIGYVPAGRSDFLKIRVTGSNEPLQLLVRASPPSIYYSVVASSMQRGTFTDLYAVNEYESSLTIPNFKACLTSLAVDGLSCGWGLVPGANCAEAASLYVGSLGIDAISSVTAGAANNYSPSSGVISLTNAGAGQVVVAAKCATSVTPGVAQVAAAVNCGFALNNISSACTGFDVFTEISKRLIPVFSHDPNDKIGSAGIGTGRYISGKEPLRYSIYFENLASATAPAQDVVITDQLDASKLDFDTFSFGPISFGVNKIIVPPPGLSDFSRDVDLRPQNNLIVRIEAKLNKTTGLLTWRFTSLDPATSLPPEDPNAGFLPPNVIAPQGEGQVLFTVRPRENLATGTEIRNRALIVFDNNAPIITPEWLNTIDYTQPESQVQPLAATQTYNSFTVNWSGTDAGAGIQSYSIFVSENGGAFNIWRKDTTQTSGVFTGNHNTTYAFYSTARDKTGNQESAPLFADAVTRTPLAPTAASVTVGGRVLSVSGRAVSRARVTLTGAAGETRAVLTNPFGYYHFDDVPAGQTYVFNVQHKSYQFSPQALNVMEETNDLDFVALP